MNTDPALLAVVAVLFVGGGILLGLAFGRGNRRLAKRCKDLEAELAGSQAELATYRQQVGQHFNATGELLRAMTLQYRAVYEHLADGARTLCPDHAPSLSAGESEVLLGPGASPSATPAGTARTGEAAPGPAAPPSARAADDEAELDELETDEDPLPGPRTTAH